MSEFDRKFITDAITRMLARREHSFSEICRKLDEIEPDWFEKAKWVKDKKFGPFKETDFKLLMKQKQFLQYRGFYSEHIEYAVKGE